MRMLTVGSAVVLAGVLAMGGLAEARSWQVPGEAPTIAAAIDSAQAGDEVVVACGLYTESGLVMKSGVSLRSESGDPACVTVDAQQNGRVLDVVDCVDVSVTGITFTQGIVNISWWENMGGAVRARNSTLTIADCAFTENTCTIGGAVGVYQSAITVTGSTFTDNVATDPYWAGGGGLWCRESSGTVSDCTFTTNTAFSDSLPGDAGGLFTTMGQIFVNDCTFIGNATGAGAGGFYSVDLDSSVVTRCYFEQNTADFGGAIYLEASRARLVDCVMHDNTAKAGGAMEVTRGSDCAFENCEFTANTATTWGGGAIVGWVSDLRFTACRFADNTAPDTGGGIFLGGINASLADCIFLANTSGNGGGALYGRACTLDLSGCTLAANSANGAAGLHLGADGTATLTRTIIAASVLGSAVVAPTATAATLSCCDVFGNAGGDWVAAIADQAGVGGNLSLDPLFCDLAGGDVGIALASPCAPAGSQGCDLIGAGPVGCGITGVDDTPRPPTLALAPNMPNPFNPATTLRYTLSTAAHTRVAVVDVAGRHVRTLVDASQAAGAHTVLWDGRDDDGRLVPAGVYLAVVSAGEARVVGRMALVK